MSMAGDALAYRVTCRSGLIWLTRENDAGDYLISGGASFTAAGPGRIVLEALEDSVICVQPLRDAREDRARGQNSASAHGLASTAKG